MKKKIYLILFSILAIIPLGLLTDSPAWGEWDREYYQKILGFIPKGIEKAKEINTPFMDYSFGSLNDIASYYLSAIIGIALIFGFFYILSKVFNAKNI